MERARAFFFRDKDHPCDVPSKAHLYVKLLAREVGYCGETCITAFAHYAQAIEGLACTEDMYILTEDFKKIYAKEI